ncbi:MAG: hypothetical protein LBP59_09200 [Planctomycetaceae bacterium]|nr:hypothetical protein [Planctomycetaceae bacterium]
MKKLLTLVFVAALSVVGSMVYADEPATVTTEAPIVIGPGFENQNFGYPNFANPTDRQFGLVVGNHFLGYKGTNIQPKQKPSLGSRIRAAREARAARKAAAAGYGLGFEGAYPQPERKLFRKANFGGHSFGGHSFGGHGFGGHGFNGGYQEFPAEFQVGGYY